MTTRDRRLALLAALVPGAISVGALALVAMGAGAAPKMAHEEGSAVLDSEDRNGRIDLGDGCHLVNGALDPRPMLAGRQRVYRSELRGALAFGWEWSLRSDAALVVSYPYLVCGVQPFGGGAAAAGFPFQQGQRPLTVEYEAAVDASGQHCLLLALWAVSGPSVKAAGVTHEIQIHVLPMDPVAPGWLVEKLPPVTIDGVTWDLWRNPDGAGARKNTRSAPGAFTWPVLVLVAQKPVLRGPLHVDHLLQHLVDQKLLPAGAWVADLELGSAVVQGEGWVRVTKFALRP